jgi:hypothetical protein
MIRAMAVPTIRYAATRDAIRVAFHTLGEGPAVVMLFPYHVNHLALNWRVPVHRGAIEFLARYFTVVNLDFRDAGLSERRIAELSLESFAEDIDSVLAELQLRRVGLCAMGPAGLIACDSPLGRPPVSQALSSLRAASQRRIVAY